VSEKDDIVGENATEQPGTDTEVQDTEVQDTEVQDTEAKDTDAEAAEADLDDAQADGDQKPDGDDVGTAKRPRRSVRTLVSAALLAVALLGSAAMAGWLYLNQYRPDQQTDQAAAQVALEAAKTGTTALLSYSPDSLDQDFANAKSKLTGDFLSYYTQFTEQIVTPAAREKSVKTAASVVRAAVSEIEPDNAEVLVFINQTTTSKENPDGAFAASSVKVGMTKIDGTWLIESFDPV
jgi:Mce-associated membrane protein